MEPTHDEIIRFNCLGKEFRIPTDKIKSLSQLKSFFQKHTGIKKHKQKFLLDGKLLDPEKPIQKFRILSDSIIHILEIKNKEKILQIINKRKMATSIDEELQDLLKEYSVALEERKMRVEDINKILEKRGKIEACKSIIQKGNNLKDFILKIKWAGFPIKTKEPGTEFVSTKKFCTVLANIDDNQDPTIINNFIKAWCKEYYGENFGNKLTPKIIGRADPIAEYAPDLDAVHIYNKNNIKGVLVTAEGIKMIKFVYNKRNYYARFYDWLVKNGVNYTEVLNKLTLEFSNKNEVTLLLTKRGREKTKLKKIIQKEEYCIRKVSNTCLFFALSDFDPSITFTINQQFSIKSSENEKDQLEKINSFIYPRKLEEKSHMKLGYLDEAIKNNQEEDFILAFRHLLSIEEAHCVAFKGRRQVSDDEKLNSTIQGKRRVLFKIILIK